MSRLLLVLAALGAGCITQKRQIQADARVELGNAYLLEGNPQSALTTLEEAVKLDRRNVDAWHQLGLTYMNLGAHDRSEKAFKRALRLTPEDAALNMNYAYLLQNLGRNDEAIERLEQAREDLAYRHPALVLNNLGYAYLSAGRTADAVAVLREAVYRSPEYCAAWYNLGLAEEQVRQTTRALEAMDRVVMLCGADYPEATLKAGELLLDLGRTDEGRLYLERARASWPGTPVSERAREVLAQAAPP